MNKLNIAIIGASGKMGRSLIETVLKNDLCQLSAAIEQKNNSNIGLDAGVFMGVQTNILISDDLEKGIADSDVLIDFTRPEGTLASLPLCIKHQTNMIIGTTGFDDEGKEAINKASEKIGIVFAPNFSVGMNLSLVLLDIAAKVLQPDYDIEVIEAHHRHKVDAPSGTALRIGEVLANATGRNLREDAIYGREGYTGERDPKTIGFSTIRAGDIVGEHTVMFATDGERVELTHNASSRMTFSNGAIRAALWLANKKGLFDMQDVLALKNISY